MTWIQRFITKSKQWLFIEDWYSYSIEYEIWEWIRIFEKSSSTSRNTFLGEIDIICPFPKKRTTLEADVWRYISPLLWQSMKLNKCGTMSSQRAGTRRIYPSKFWLDSTLFRFLDIVYILFLIVIFLRMHKQFKANFFSANISIKISGSLLKFWQKIIDFRILS